MAIRILIDTDLWNFGLKAPFLTTTDPDINNAIAAQSFLRKTLRKNVDLLFSAHLVAEIFHVLTRKGNQIPADQAIRLIRDLLERKGTVYRPVSQAIFERAAELSKTNNLPLWDYLVAIPFEDGIDRIYTLDAHFQHPSLAGLAEIENPIGIWK